MKVLVNAATLLVGYFLFVCPPAFSQEQGAFLTPAQTKTYHACLTAEWVEDYCRSHAWGIFGTYDRTNAACVSADRGEPSLLTGRRFVQSNEGYCWDLARSSPPR
jgi:hypothetical protein